MTKNINLTIITVCYNSSSSIQSTLESIDYLKKKYNFEYIVVDGGSVDGTISILGDYSYLIDSLISEPDSGIYNALNKGIKISKNNIIGILHSGDIFSESVDLKYICSLFSKPASADLVSGVSLIDFQFASIIKRRYFFSRFRPWMLCFGLSPPHTATFIKKSVLFDLKLCNEKFDICSDFDFFSKFYNSENKYNSIFCENLIVKMMPAGVSGESANKKQITQEILESLELNNMYSSYFLVIMRYFIKFILQIRLSLCGARNH
jgi:glycosyltransferase